MGLYDEWKSTEPDPDRYDGLVTTCDLCKREFVSDAEDDDRICRSCHGLQGDLDAIRLKDRNADAYTRWVKANL